MYIIDLVRSATDKAAPSFEHPHRVVGGIVAATSLVGLWFVWAILPWGWLANLIVTLLGATTLVIAIEVAHRSILQRKARKAELANLQSSNPAPIESQAQEETEPGSQELAEYKASTKETAGNDTPTLVQEAIKERLDEAVQDGNQAVLQEILEELRAMRAEANQHEEPLPEDTSVYWDEIPHVWYFIVRFWRILVPGLLSLALIILVGYAYYRWLAWGLGPLVVCLSVMVALGLGTAWYIGRRTYKWNHLKIDVIGYDFIISEPVSKFYLLLTGEDLIVPIIDCNNFVTSQTRFQRFFNLECGNLYIDSPIGEQSAEFGGDDGGKKKINDKFKNLTWVRRHKELARLLRTRRADILFRQGKTSSVPLKHLIS